MKKILTMSVSGLLAAAMLFSFAGCKNNNNPGTGTATTDPGTTPAGDYTYNAAVITFPTTWNPHTQQTNDDTLFLEYINPGLFVFDYNDTKDGYQLVPEVATGTPVDVTADYVGKYGIEEGDIARAYKITIRNDVKWQDGTAVTADTFVNSAKLLLDPVAGNYRADMLYGSVLVLANAEEYFKQNKTYKEPNATTTSAADMKYAMSALVKGADGAYATADGDAVYFGLKTSYAWTNASSLEDYKSYMPAGVWDALAALADEDGYVKVTDESIALLYQFTGSDDWGNESQDQLGFYVSYDHTYSDMDWADVGIIKTGDYEFVIALEKPLQGFNLLYALADSWLVNETLYESCATVKDGVYTTTYGTSVETTMSYGPYKLTEFQSDKSITLEKNDQFYGYKDDAYKGTYQTTKINYQHVPEPSTRLEMFLNGQLDTYGLTADDMKDYSTSDYTYYTTGESTFFMAFNPNRDALIASQASVGANINKSIISLKEFRMAMSFALDRAAFCLATSPTNNAAFGVYSSLIISDPEAGIAYRTTDEAKQVIVKFWGLEDDIGEGKLYATVDDAIDSITGYNLTKAQELFNTAYDMAIEQKLMDADDVIEINIGTPNNTSPFYVNGYKFLVDNYTDAVKGTKLEGKLTFKNDNTLGNGFSDALKANKVDMLFGVGWTGSALDPYNLMEAYTGSQYQYDPAWNTDSEKLTIHLKDKDYSATVWAWTQAIMGEKITIVDADNNSITYSAGSVGGDPSERLMILAELENAVLETYDMIPIMDDSSATLKGMQIKYYTEDYIYGVGRGGIKYMTYEYNDADWAAFVASNNGTLNYK